MLSPERLCRDHQSVPYISGQDLQTFPAERRYLLYLFSYRAKFRKLARLRREFYVVLPYPSLGIVRTPV